MPNTPIIYSSADVSAPALNQTAGIAAGSLNALLKAILVDGYGAKVAAGWTLTNTDTTTYGFLTGSGSSASYLIVEDLGTSAKVSSAKSIVSLEPTVGTLVTTELVVRKNDATGARSWWVMANSRYIYMFIDSGNTNSYALSLFAGDLNSIKSADDKQFMVAASEISSTTVRCPFFINTTGILNSTNNGISTIIQSASTIPVAGASCALLRPFHTNNAIWPIGGGTGVIANPNVPNDGYMFSLCCIVDDSAQPRGFLPNAYYPWHALPLADDTVRDLGTINIIAKSFDDIEAGSSGGEIYESKGQIWLDFESSF